MNKEAKIQLVDKIKNKKLALIAEKIVAKEPVSRDDGLFLLQTDDILELGLIADHMRKELHGRNVFYSVNMNLNYTNICELRCPLCAFSRNATDNDAYLLSIDDAKKRVKEKLAFGIDEVHIVACLNPDLTLDYYEDLLRGIKKIAPRLFIVAFTAVEYDYFAKKSNLSVDEVITRMIDAGLDSIPGGGAEIFDPEIRKKIAPKKISAEKWLAIMKTAHAKGLKTNATLLYNHLEKPEHIADHLLALRNTQEETGGFKTFVPLAFHGENTRIQSKKRDTTGFDDIRLYAASRIILHNIPHIKALWMYLGEKMAQVLLSFGVDDLGGTYIQEKIVHAAGAGTPDFGSENFLIHLIENAGFKPVRTTAGYEK